MSMYCEQIFSITFTCKTRKQSYLEGCKWVAKNILSNEKLKSIFIEYEKVKDSTSIKVNLYTYIKEDEVREQHCNICKELHKTIFITEDTNCAWCRIKGYQNRIDRNLNVKKEFYRTQL